jgi:hypothetical protein
MYESVTPNPTGSLSGPYFLQDTGGTVTGSNWQNISNRIYFRTVKQFKPISDAERILKLYTRYNFFFDFSRS